jgi:ferritin-like metal-binding protein YciE
LAKAAQHRKLQAAFEKHHAETETHVSRLEQVFSAIDAKPQGKTCDAILGIVEEGQEIMKEYKDSPALDAGLPVLHRRSQATRNSILGQRNARPLPFLPSGT